MKPDNMSPEEIFLTNLLGLLKMGRWNLDAEEAEVLVSAKIELSKRIKDLKQPDIKVNEIKPIIENVQHNKRHKNNL